MKVLGIDPGYGRCGYAVVERVGSKESLIITGCIETFPSDGEDRLTRVGQEIRAIIKKQKPDLIAIEKIFFTKNISTGIGVAEARGVVRFLARDANIPVLELGPAAIKIAITGSGNADKRMVGSMVMRLLSLRSPLVPDDAADAAAIAITGIAHSGILQHQK